MEHDRKNNYENAPSFSFLFRPRSIAIVGASANPGKPGNILLHNLKSMGFQGRVFPINPSLGAIDSWKCYPNIESIDEPLDLVVSLVSPENTVILAREIEERNLERHDVKFLICISGGFSETGTENGSTLEEDLVSTLRRAGTRLLGPNCLGVIDTSSGLTTNFDIPSYKSGKTDIITQSGAFGNSFLFWCKRLGLVGLNRLVSLGNMRDVDLVEVIQELGINDEDVERAQRKSAVIGVYLEGHKDPRTLVMKMGEAARKKPIVVLKVGRTQSGKIGARSHTGSIAGNDVLYSSAFEQYGIIRADSVSEFYDTIRAFEKQTPPRGKRVAVLTHVGGPGTICLDAIGSYSELELAHISDETKNRLRLILSISATISKPDGYIDVTAEHSEHLHNQVLKLLFSEDSVDSVIQIMGPSTFLNQRLLAEEIWEAYDSQKEKDRTRKTFLNVFMFGSEAEECRRYLEEKGLPTFDYPDLTVKVLRNMTKYGKCNQRAGSSREIIRNF